MDWPRCPGRTRCSIRPNAQPLEVTRGEIRFEDVRFAYGGERPLIERFNLTIRPGEKIGLVGRSGAGKSTLVNLLLRFHDVEGGCIRIDGQDIAGVQQDSLRARIGMVTQDTSLLHRSVRDNILYGRPDAGDARDGGGGPPGPGTRVHPAAVGSRRAHRLRRACG